MLVDQVRLQMTVVLFGHPLHRPVHRRVALLQILSLAASVAHTGPFDGVRGEKKLFLFVCESFFLPERGDFFEIKMILMLAYRRRPGCFVASTDCGSCLVEADCGLAC